MDLGRARRAIALTAMFVSTGVVGPAQAQPVQGALRNIGFPLLGDNSAIRAGRWTPLVVELTGVGSEPIEVEVRVQARDLDGDVVSYVERPPPLAGGAARRVYVNAVVQRLDGLEVVVAPRNGGAPILTLPAPLLEVLPDDVELVLDLSQPALGFLGALRSSAPDLSTLAGEQRYFRHVAVARQSPNDLPVEWFGLESVDVIVWDAPAVDDPFVQSKLPALIEWVRRGGRLVIGLGEAALAVQKSPLGEILPAAADEVVDTRRLQRFFERYVREDVTAFPSDVRVAVQKARGGGVAVVRDALPDGRAVDLVVTGCVGAGRVTVVAARLRDLTDAQAVPLASRPPDQTARFAYELLDLNRTPEAFKDREREVAYFPTTVTSFLYDRLVRPIEFRYVGSLFTGTAFVFVVGYILVATVGSWLYLRARRKTQLSWSVFAVCAVAASVLSLGAVQCSRGSALVDAVAIVDTEAGATRADARLLLGFRSPQREEPLLTVDGEGSFVRPLAAPPGGALYYATPLAYRAEPDAARLVDVPLRATLKQFEGAWAGELEGAIRANLRASRESGRIAAESWLANELSVAISGGYLLYIDPRLGQRRELADIPARAGGWGEFPPTWDQGWYGHLRVPPAANVLAVPIGEIAVGQTLRGIGTEEYRAFDQRYSRWLNAASPAANHAAAEPELGTLHDLQQAWMRADRFNPLAASVDDFWAAAGLASTRNLYLHTAGNDFDFKQVGTPVSTGGLPNLDISHWLLRGEAVLILFTDTGGVPATLRRGETPLRTRGRAVYRVRAPLAYE